MMIGVMPNTKRSWRASLKLRRAWVCKPVSAVRGTRLTVNRIRVGVGWGWGGGQGEGVEQQDQGGGGVEGRARECMMELGMAWGSRQICARKCMRGTAWGMYMYIYIYIYIHVCVNLHVAMVYLYIYIYIYIVR